MDALDLARWQFAITTVFHFFFVPLSIGLAVTVAIMQTAWVRTRDLAYLRMTRFWGKLFLINFAMGVVTGIVQEFQFGMNWSAYSRYVGDIFGAPLAIEGLLAFFLESTFLGLWIFGWDKLPEKLHLATIWLVAAGTAISAFFILAANSWMQHPVGYRVNPATGRAELHDFFALLTNSTLWTQFPHTVLSALATAAFFVLGVSGYHLLRKREVDVFRKSASIALVIGLIASVGVALVGHTMAQLMTRQEPMKMAAAEALYRDERGASFSLLTIGNLSGDPLLQIRVPKVLSVLATNSLNGRVEGIDDLQARFRAEYGPGSYVPVLWVTYWTFRLMVGAGILMVLLALWGLVLLRRRRLPESRWFLRIAVAALFLPMLANATGWIFTETGRQPWVVYGLLKTSSGVSPAVGAGFVAITLFGFIAIYGLLTAVDAWLMTKVAKAGPATGPADVDGPPEDVAAASLTPMSY